MTSVCLLNHLATLFCIYPAVAPMEQGARFIIWNGYIHIKTNAALNFIGKNSSAFCFHICRYSMITHTHNINSWHQQRCICHWNGAGAGAADSSNKPQDTTGSPRHNVLTHSFSLFPPSSSFSSPPWKGRMLGAEQKRSHPPFLFLSLSPSISLIRIRVIADRKRALEKKQLTWNMSWHSLAVSVEASFCFPCTSSTAYFPET